MIAATGQRRNEMATRKTRCARMAALKAAQAVVP